jgi:hypothetical protein
MPLPEPNPQEIGNITWLLDKIYYYAKDSKSDFTRKNFLHYLQKYTNTLMEWEMALLDGKVPKNIDWNDVKRQVNYDYEGQVTRILRNIEKLFKLAVLVEDKELKNEVLKLLFDTTNLFLEHVTALEDEESIDEVKINKELNGIEKRVEELMKIN